MALKTSARACSIKSIDGKKMQFAIDRNTVRGDRKLRIDGVEYKQSQFRKLKNWLEFVLEG